MPSQYELLGAARINGILQGLQDVRLLPPQLLWVRRIPDTPSLDEEIMARFIGTPVIADLIADDAKAVTYSFGRFQFETNKIPNLKMGYAMNQGVINQVARLVNDYAAPSDMGIFNDYLQRTLQAAYLGVQQRKEVLLVAMLLDNLNYDRLGIKMSNVTWGMPSDLKVTTGVTWDTAASATPVNDIWGVQLIARVRYGIVFNRITMSTTAFRFMIATTEFQNKARMFLAPNVSFINITQANLNALVPLANNILSAEIELYDARTWQQDYTGALYNAPILPVNQVLLTATANDQDRNVLDFANGIVSESRIAGIVGNSVVGRLPADVYGPVAYVTPSDSALNPPGAVIWGVARGFPRKKLLQSSAALTVGTFADTIPTTVPFPA